MFLSEGVRQGEENLGAAEPLRGSVLGRGEGRWGSPELGQRR